MRGLKLLHTGDLHLDSPFQALSMAKAAQRRGEQRDLLSALAELAIRERVDAVLLSGDLLDSDRAYCETGLRLISALGRIGAPVFISPGNHDYYSSRSPYATLKLPENVHIFRKNEIERVDMGGRGFAVFGAAFTDSQSHGLLGGFSAPRREGVYNLMCLHADVDKPGSPYNPVSAVEIARSSMDYIAFGHVHTADGPHRAGRTHYAYCGCPEGRGFDECGEKSVYIVELSDDNCSLRPVSIATRKYIDLEVDVTGLEPMLAVHSALPEETVRDICRIRLKGETDGGLDLNRIYASLEDLFFQLRLTDETRPALSPWEAAGKDSLRGLFLKKLKEQYDRVQSETGRQRIEQAARWGLAALNNSEEVLRHDN